MTAAAIDLDAVTAIDVHVHAERNHAEEQDPVTLEVLELQRVPSTTDVIGKYEVTLDKDGEVTGLQRTRRFTRAESGEV